MRTFLLTLGAILLLAGLAWPWLAKLPLGRLPGDIVIMREGSRLYIPITSMLLISIAISIILWIIGRFK